VLQSFLDWAVGQGVQADVVLLAGGPLAPELTQVARLVDEPIGPYDVVLANTTESLAGLERWELGGCPVVVWVHEPPWVLQHWVPEEALKAVPSVARAMCVSARVADAVRRRWPDLPTAVVPPFIDVAALSPSPSASSPVGRAHAVLGLSPSDRIVGSVGTTDWRKGPDLAVALRHRLGVLGAGSDVHSVWVGGEPVGPEVDPTHQDVEHAGLGGLVHLVGEQPDARAWMVDFEVLAMVSRADPFPLTVLEAAVLGVPVVGFDTTGLADLLDADAPALVPFPDLDRLARVVLHLLDDPSAAAEQAAALSRRVQDRHDVPAGAPALLAQLEEAAGLGAASP